MKLTALLGKLEEYFYPFDTYDDAIKYIKSNNYVGVTVNGYTNTPYYQKKTQYHVSDEDFDKSFNELIRYYEIHCKAMFKCLNLKEESIIPETDKARNYGTKQDAYAGAIMGGGLGALIGGILGGGLWLLAAGIGAALGSEKYYGDDKLTASCKTLYNNSLNIGKECVEYFTKAINELIYKGVTDTFIEPEWAIYYAKLICPKCGKRLKARNGKYGWFMSCTGYPSCNYSTKYIPVPKQNKKEDNSIF